MRRSNTSKGFEIDALLLGICDELRLRGLHIGGVLQSSHGARGQCAASVLVTDLRSGEVFDIWDRRGTGARGCRLDEGGLLDAEPAINDAIAANVDLLVVNRFGRAESLGRGLIGSFTAAIEAGIPILTAVRAPYDDAWRAVSRRSSAATCMADTGRLRIRPERLSANGSILRPVHRAA